MLNQILQGDCLKLLQAQPDNSVDLIATDPPYFRVKGEAWDNQWASAAAFLDWIDALCVEWRRVLKPNGSLYVFASPQMAGRVEATIWKHFNVLNNIRWEKPSDNSERRHVAQIVDKGLPRAFYGTGERCIFAEHFGADNMAKGEAGYAAKCDELRGFVFEPLRAYLDGERDAAGLNFDAVRTLVGCALGSGLPSHWFTSSQFGIPSPAKYAALQTSGRFARPYESIKAQYEQLRQQYEQLRQQYEQLRRPFAVTADVPYTDVWTFATVGYYKGKHVCEKPAALMEHIINSSSRPGAVVLDCFMGSNATGKAARKLGRAYIGMELDPHWIAKARAEQPAPAWQALPRPAVAPHHRPTPAPAQRPLLPTHTPHQFALFS